MAKKRGPKQPPPEPGPQPPKQPNPKGRRPKASRNPDPPNLIPNPPPPIQPPPSTQSPPRKSSSKIPFHTVLQMESYSVRRYTQQQIADILGVDRITVHRCLAKLNKMRLDRANPRNILADRIGSLHHIIEQAWKAWDKTLSDEPGIMADPDKPAGPFNRDLPGKRGLGNDKYLQTIRDAQRELSQIYMVGEYDPEYKRILRETGQSETEGDANSENVSALELRRELEYLRERLKEERELAFPQQIPDDSGNRGTTPPHPE